MHWQESHRADPEARALADRHYSRQKPGTPQFVPPGRCVVLKIPGLAYWVTSYPFAEWVKHAWAGAWVCSAFRNESDILSSTLIRQAISATRCLALDKPNWDLPDMGMVTFVDAGKVRKKRDPGRCYTKAGFTRLKETTAGGLIVLQMTADQMPDPHPPFTTQKSFDFR